MRKILAIAFVLIWILPACSQSKKNTQVVHLTKETFKQKVFDYEKSKTWQYKGTQPCIIDFYADWCRPCKMLAPILEQLSTEYKGKLIIYKVDTQTQQELSAAFGIESLPSLLFVPKTGEPQMAVGYMEKAELKKLVVSVLKVK